MKKTTRKADSRRAAAKKPVARKLGARATTPARPVPKASSATYMPAPIQTLGRAPFRYPPQ